MKQVIRVFSIALSLAIVRCGAQGTDDDRSHRRDITINQDAAVRDAQLSPDSTNLFGDAARYRAVDVTPSRAVDAAPSRAFDAMPTRGAEETPSPSATSDEHGRDSQVAITTDTPNDSGREASGVVHSTTDASGVSRNSVADAPGVAQPASANAAVPCACVPGSSIGCSCATGDRGAQVCRADCRGYEPCQCEPGKGAPGTIGDDAGSASEAPVRSDSGSTALTTPADLPAFLTIQIVDILVSPAGPDGTTWDGLSSVDPSKLEQLSVGLGAVSSYAAVAGVTASIALSEFQAPDPYGYMSRWDGSEWSNELELTVADDQVHPQWPGIGWAHVAVDPSLRMRISLWDDDYPFSSEAIGTVEIGYEDIIDALQSARLWQVKTSVDASRQPILFVGISVTAETEHTPEPCEGGLGEECCNPDGGDCPDDG